jgi:hypothetical protein
MFRNRLNHIENEEELFEYFKKNAGYDEGMQCYVCAGLASDDTALLLKKLKKAWAEEKLADAIFVKARLKKELDETQAEVDRLEEEGVKVGDAHQAALIKMGELMTQIAEFDKE